MHSRINRLEFLKVFMAYSNLDAEFNKARAWGCMHLLRSEDSAFRTQLSCGSRDPKPPVARWNFEERRSGAGETPLLRLLFRVDEMAAAVMLPALIVVLGTERFFFTVADRLDVGRTDAALHQGVLHGIGAVVAQGEVIFLRAALVAVSLNRELHVGMLLQEVDISL